MKRLYSLLTAGIIAVGLLITVGCNTSLYNLRAIVDTNRDYISADSSVYLMKWNTPSWRTNYLKYWTSAGVIVTNEYNLFKENKWLEYVIDGGFEGMIVLQWDPEKVYTTWSTETDGSFRKQIYDVNQSYGSGVYVDNLATQAYSQFDDGSYVLKPSLFTTNEVYGNQIAQIVKAKFDTLDANYDTNGKITFGFMLPYYPYHSYGPISEVSTSLDDFDPFSLSKAITSYTTSDYETYVDPYYDAIVDAFNRSHIVTMVKGRERLITEVPSSSLLGTRKIDGVMFKNVSPSNLDSITSAVDTFRTAFIPSDSTSSLIFIAGIKNDVYHSSSPTAYASMIKTLIDKAVYFTPGSNDVYFDSPFYGQADWWFRNNNDSNWQSNPNNPTYASLAVSPRYVLEPGSSIRTLTQPLYFEVSYIDPLNDGGKSQLQYDQIASVDVGVISSFVYECDSTLSSWDSTFVGYIDSVRARNSDWIGLVYTDLDGPPEAWATYPLGGVRRNIYDLYDDNDAWAVDTLGNVVQMGNAGVGYYTRIYGVTDTTITKQMVSYYIDGLQKTQAGVNSEFIGIMGDWMNDGGYPSWPVNASGDPIVNSLDFNKNGIPYVDDPEEAQLYVDNCRLILRTFKSEFRNRGMLNRPIVMNGTVWNDTIANQYVDGAFLEDYDYRWPEAWHTAETWETAFGLTDRFVNSCVDPPLVLFSAYISDLTSSDSSKTYETEPISIIANGYASVSDPDNRYGTSNIVSLSRRLPKSGALISGPTFIDGPSGTGVDTLVAEFENYTVKRLQSTSATSGVALGAVPRGYLVYNGTDTISVGGFTTSGDVAWPGPEIILPEITSVSDESITSDQTLFVAYGTNFGTSGTLTVSNTSDFSANNYSITSAFTWNDSTIANVSFTPNSNWQTGDSLYVRVVNSYGTSPTYVLSSTYYKFTTPVITSVTPDSFMLGDTLTVVGTGFLASGGSVRLGTSTTSVSNVLESSSSWSDTEISMVISAADTTAAWANPDILYTKVSNTDGKTGVYATGNTYYRVDPTFISYISEISGDVYMEWDPSTHAVSYNIYRGTTIGSQAKFDSLITSPYYTDSSVVSDTTYYYYVTCVDRNGNESSESGIVSITPTNYMLPVVSSFNVVSITDSLGNVNLRFNAGFNKTVDWKLLSWQDNGTEPDSSTVSFEGSSVDSIDMIYPTTLLWPTSDADSSMFIHWQVGDPAPTSGYVLDASLNDGSWIQIADTLSIGATDTSYTYLTANRGMLDYKLYALSGSDSSSVALMDTSSFNDATKAYFRIQIYDGTNYEESSIQSAFAVNRDSMVADTTPPDTTGVFSGVVVDTTNTSDVLLTLTDMTINEPSQVQFEWSNNNGSNYYGDSSWSPTTASTTVGDTIHTGISTANINDVYTRFRLRDDESSPNISGWVDHQQPFTRATPSAGDTILYVFSRSSAAYTATDLGGGRWMFISPIGDTLYPPKVVVVNQTQDYRAKIDATTDSLTVWTGTSSVPITAANALPLSPGSASEASLMWYDCADSLSGLTVITARNCIRLGVFGISSGTKVISAGMNTSNVSGWATGSDANYVYYNNTSLLAWSPRLDTYTQWSQFTAGEQDTTMAAGGPFTSSWIEIPATLAAQSWANGDPNGGFWVGGEASPSDAFDFYQMATTTSTSRPVFWVLGVK